MSDRDLELLDEYRLSHSTSYDTIVRLIVDCFQLEPTGRPAKSTSSIIEKLQRESLRLAQMQDIAGCRLIVDNSYTQDTVSNSLMQHLSRDGIQRSMIDRRTNPSNGYRAIHIVATWSERHVEIQIRTELQHLWAEFSEKLSDIIDYKIKYGGGAEEIQTVLQDTSRLVSNHEKKEYEFGTFIRSFSSEDQVSEHQYEIENLKVDLDARRTALLNGFRIVIQNIIDRRATK